jgi:hypothetical protein
MWGHLWSILALGALCAAWVLIQRWLARVDPGGRSLEDAAGCCGGCKRDCDKER